MCIYWALNVKLTINTKNKTRLRSLKKELTISFFSFIRSCCGIQDMAVKSQWRIKIRVCIFFIDDISENDFHDLAYSFNDKRTQFVTLKLLIACVRGQKVISVAIELFHLHNPLKILGLEAVCFSFCFYQNNVEEVLGKISVLSSMISGQSYLFPRPLR